MPRSDHPSNLPHLPRAPNDPKGCTAQSGLPNGANNSTSSPPTQRKSKGAACSTSAGPQTFAPRQGTTSASTYAANSRRGMLHRPLTSSPFRVQWGNPPSASNQRQPPTTGRRAPGSGRLLTQAPQATTLSGTARPTGEEELARHQPHGAACGQCHQSRRGVCKGEQPRPHTPSTTTPVASTVAPAMRIIFQPP